MRLFIYSQDGLGLGHLRRTHNIAREVVERDQDAEVLIIADSPVAPFFAALPRVRYLTLPTIVKTGDSSWSARGQGLAATVSQRAGRIRDAFVEFAPDAMLVDHMPAGALGELMPTLDELARSERPAKLFLGLRDVLDRPETIRNAWTEAGAYEVLDRYDGVFVYGCRDVHDSAEVYGLTRAAQDVIFCNYVATRRRPAAPPLGAEEPLVLFTAGGGADAFPLAQTFLDALPLVLDDAPARACVLTGPNMSPAERTFLEERASGLPVTIPKRGEDAIPWLAHAAVVVTMAGYNSLCEVLQWRRRALVVPRRGPSAEQRIRARLFADRGLVRTLDPDAAGPYAVANEVVGLLSEPVLPASVRIPELDGAEQAAARLLEATLARSHYVGEGGGR